MNTSSPQAIAQAITDIYGKGQTLASISSAQRDDFIDLLGVYLNADDLLNYEQRILSKASLVTQSQQVLNRWLDKTRSLDATSKQASEFVGEWFSSFGLSELYNHKMLVGVTSGSLYSSAASVLSGAEEMPCWGLHFVLDGESCFYLDGVAYQAKAGDLIVVKPGVKYAYGQVEKIESNRHLWVLFQPRPQWSLWMRGEAISEQVMRLSINNQVGQSKVQSLFSELLDISNSCSKYKNEYLYNHLEKIWIQIQEYQTSDGRYDSRIQRACEFIENNLSRKISVGDVAKACNLSSSWLAHLFKDEMGVSLKHWHNGIRLQEAQKYLSATDQSISSISKSLGYEDPAVFTKSFTKNMKCSPSEFRENHKKPHQ